MIVNRVGFVFFTFSISFSIDKAIAPNLVLSGFIFSLLAFLGSYYLFPGHYDKFHRVRLTVNYLNSMSFLATILSFIGTTLPWFAASIYPEYRLTLANTGFIFNTFFTVINTFIIEQRIASAFDEKDQQTEALILGICLSRVIATFTALVAFSVSILIFG